MILLLPFPGSVLVLARRGAGAGAAVAAAVAVEADELHLGVSEVAVRHADGRDPAASAPAGVHSRRAGVGGRSGQARWGEGG